MSVPYGGPPGGPGWDPKAQAKADKAYRKAQRPFYKKKRFILPVALLTLIVIAVASNSGGSSQTVTKPVAGAPSSTAACPQPYPDKQKTDHCSDTTGSVTLSGMAVTAKNLARSTGSLGTEICSDVSMVNNSNKTLDFNQFYFKLQTPAGEVKSFELAYQTTLNSGQLVAGGSKSGKVCSQDVPGTTGQFVLIYKPSGFSSDRGIWLFNL